MGPAEVSPRQRALVGKRRECNRRAPRDQVSSPKSAHPPFLVWPGDIWVPNATAGASGRDALPQRRFMVHRSPSLKLGVHQGNSLKSDSTGKSSTWVLGVFQAPRAHPVSRVNV